MNKLVNVTNVVGAAFAIILLGLGALFVSTIRVSDQTRQNQAYARVQICILSISAAARTPLDIENCYLTAEKQLNISLNRYTVK